MSSSGGGGAGGGAGAGLSDAVPLTGAAVGEPGTATAATRGDHVHPGLTRVHGTTVLDFGAFPGGSDATVAVTGQAEIVAESSVTAWVSPVATADHSADEHWVEEVAVSAGDVVPGTGFTVYGVHRPATNAATGLGTRLYGVWTIGWAWS